MKNLLVCVIALSVVSSCGVKMESPDMESSRESDSLSSNGAERASAPDFNTMEISGFIVSAFNVTVDGESYSDLEQFYTRAVERLPSLVKAAGYDDSYKVSLQADVGFKDLWTQMDVFVLANAKNGYQSHTYVNHNGGFKTYVPKNSSDVEYKIRGVKRIGVTVSKDNERKYFCYNFSAKEQSAHFSSDPNPVIINEFVTELTTYKCAGQAHTGFEMK